VKKGDNILTLRLRDVRERVLRYPWVRDVRLSKRFPARLFIWVEEEEPAALIEIDSKFYLVSREGKVFKELDASDPKDFPILTGLSVEEIPERLPRLMALVKSIETSELFGALGISEARWDAREGLKLFTKEPCIQLTLGPEGGALSWEARLQRFAQAWSTIQGGGRTPQVVDLSLDRRVVVREGRDL
jgi:cell division protein FtsQ